MKHHMGTPVETKKTPELIDKEMNRDITRHEELPYAKEWEKLNAYPLFLDGEYTMKREVTYPIDHLHGNYSFREIFDVCHLWEKELSHHPLHPEKRRPEDFLFFDTETTGLNSGAGNLIFLLGSAAYDDNQIKVNQYFLPGPEAEAAFYYYFLSETRSTHHLVTYNGKAFDWPQVKTRHTFVRNEVPKLPPFGHFDLLHAARRLLRHRLPSCKLSIVEKEILGVERVEDTPGYLAPMLYFDYLHEQHPEYIEGVLEHNEWDVLSLITLYIDLSKRVLAKGTSSRERMEIGKWYEQLNEWEKAEWCHRKVFEASDNQEIKQESSLRVGRALKKQKQEREAMYYFEWAFRHPGMHQYEAAIELAKYYEHRVKDPEKALHFIKYIQPDKSNVRDDITKRRLRLQKKIEREIPPS